MAPPSDSASEAELVPVAEADPQDPPIKLTYLFTTFPKSTETFLQREVLAMQARGLELRVYSLFGGGGDFHGIPVRKFSMWRLLELFWIIPHVAITRWDVFGILWHGLWTRRAPSWLNFWENMLGAGFAGVFQHELRNDPPDLIHAAWGGAPATAAWILHRLDGHRFSAAAHAYDIYEHGGDWWLDEKLTEARFIHTSTGMGRDSLIARGHDAAKVRLIRRGLETFPEFKRLRADRSALRLVCIARLVAKKGLDHQLRIYAALRDAGVPFAARIIGEGPERARVERLRAELGLDDQVTLTGHLGQPEVWAQLAWADCLLHTGVVAPSGDRDGLPNVIPEAMAAGVVVLTSPHAATTEAITHEETGFVCRETEPEAWVTAFQRVREDDVLTERLRENARAWTEANFDAHTNAAVLHGCFREAVSQP
ncbi:glycosyltransferase family 4 protein [Actomonas aquatica]|uniref:Glycosyltransferase family 4 protein n=1 Tax=Actomonas aquatica TaxID=2866162 RepID=A0ABZ1CAY4_9BACT|nr:glycosyltransferase family 4 protein [Opitutus sp. WL0086]WRQ88535.1 glycosyltransferase family 4 protein [Opitutus sp. WL0086]